MLKRWQRELCFPEPFPFCVRVGQTESHMRLGRWKWSSSHYLWSSESDMMKDRCSRAQGARSLLFSPTPRPTLLPGCQTCWPQGAPGPPPNDDLRSASCAEVPAFQKLSCQFPSCSLSGTPMCPASKISVNTLLRRLGSDFLLILLLDFYLFTSPTVM